MMADVSRKRKSDDNLEGAQRAKVRKTIHGVSRQQLPTVVIAMGFLIGTTSDDIRQALTALSSHDAESLPPHTIRASSCQLLSTGPKVVAKLIFPNLAVAKEVVLHWDGTKVDGGELSVWITDDIAEEPPTKSEPRASERNTSPALLPARAADSSASPTSCGFVFGASRPSITASTFPQGKASSSALFGGSNANAGTKSAQKFNIFGTPATDSACGASASQSVNGLASSLSTF